MLRLAIPVLLTASLSHSAAFKVLCIGLGDPNHPGTGAAGNKAVQEIAAGKDFTVDAVTDMGKVTEAGLAEYRVMIWTMAWPGNFSAATQSAVQKFVESGKGLISFHVSGLTGISNPEWQWYMDLMGGGTFKGHPATRQNGTVKMEASAADHPALAGIPATWVIHEEWYSWNKSAREAANIRILATVDESTYSPGGSNMPGDHPVMWSNTRYGPHIYTAMGHEPEAFSNANMRKLLANAIPWAAKTTSTAVTPNLAPARKETPALRWDGHALRLLGAVSALDLRGRAMPATQAILPGN